MMKRMAATVVIAASAFLVGCGGDSSVKTEVPESADVGKTVTQNEVRNTVGLVQSMQLNMLASGMSQAFATQLGIPTTSRQVRVTYPAPYEKVRDCSVSGNVNTVGEKSNIITYHVTNTFTDCTHIDDVVVNGTQTVDATFMNNKLVATMSDNEISISRGGLSMNLTSPMVLYADRDFNTVEIILQESGGLYEEGNTFDANFHDFNVTINTGDSTMYLNGLVESEACGVGAYNIETVEPMVPNADGSFSSGELNINGVRYEYHDDYTVTATLSSGDVFVIPQGVGVFCELDSL